MFLKETNQYYIPGSKSYNARADGVDWAAGGGAEGAGASLCGAIGADIIESEVFNEFELPLFSNLGREMNVRSWRGRLAASDNLNTTTKS